MRTVVRTPAHSRAGPEREAATDGLSKRSHPSLARSSQTPNYVPGPTKAQSNLIRLTHAVLPTIQPASRQTSCQVAEPCTNHGLRHKLVLIYSVDALLRFAGRAGMRVIAMMPRIPYSSERAFASSGRLSPLRASGRVRSLPAVTRNFSGHTIHESPEAPQNTHRVQV